MTKKKKGILPSIEIIIILVFFLCFILWAVSKCGATKATYPNTVSEEDNKEQSLIDSITMIPLQPKELPLKEDPVVVTTPTTTSNATTTTGQNTLSKLYITIDGLKLRTAPSLNSEVIMTFALFDEVYFLNEVTDSTYQISLGKEIANEPWVKVQSKRGKVGWVYGAGVNYYRKKRSGVQ